MKLTYVPRLVQKTAFPQQETIQTRRTSFKISTWKDNKEYAFGNFQNFVVGGESCQICELRHYLKNMIPKQANVIKSCLNVPKIRLLRKHPFIKKIGVFRRMREFRLRRELLNNGTTNYILDQWQSQPDNLVMLCKFFCVYRPL